MTFKIALGDCLDKLKKLPENSVDSIVCDPPYGLSFMTHKWDYDVPSVDIWKECLRVLKPGGHMLAFGGTRTYHRLVVAIEDAGFEIRDQIQWIYGQGFPKSQDISKAIDKAAGAEREVVGFSKSGASSVGFEAKSRGEIKPAGKMSQEFDITNPSTPEAKQWSGYGTALKPANEIICLATKPMSDSDIVGALVRDLLVRIGATLCRYQSFALAAMRHFKSNHDAQTAPSIAQWIVENNTLTLVDLQGLMGTLLSESETNTFSNTAFSWSSTLTEVSQLTNTFTTEMALSLIIDLKTLRSLAWENMLATTTQDGTATLGTTPIAFIAGALFSVVSTKLLFTRECSAHGNATLLVAHSSPVADAKTLSNPICLARKPLSESTIAKNVLKHGTGGLNIDGTRIETDEKLGRVNNPRDSDSASSFNLSKTKQELNTSDLAGGRFPANVIFDEHAAAVLDEQTKDTRAGKPSGTGKVGAAKGGASSMFGNDGAVTARYDDEDITGASRFFYCAKASKSDRGEGNGHPTVKPIKLMEYLCKLVTPEGGTVLDPFMGSGTTGVAALRTGFSFLGVEREENYFYIAQARLEKETP